MAVSGNLLKKAVGGHSLPSFTVSLLKFAACIVDIAILDIRLGPHMRATI